MFTLPECQDVIQATVRPAVRMNGIVKRFGKVLAVDHADLVIQAGSIHAVVGENGAGKSTLMRILYGFYSADEGMIEVRGRQLIMSNPHVAIANGIGMVHQELMLIPKLSVLDNVLLGHEPRRGMLIDRTRGQRDVGKLLESMSFNLDLRARTGDLSVGQQQKVELIKVLYRGASILILDEPTAVLTPQEVDELLKILARLREQGKTIILITHKLDEVMEISDCVTVMRRGKTVKTLKTCDTSPRELAYHMVGRDVLLAVRKERAAVGAPILQVEKVSLRKPSGGRLSLKEVTFQVRAGEIVGIAGVAGNGQSELVEVVTGLVRPSAGRIMLNGIDVTDADVRGKRNAGIAHIPEDRKRLGLIMNFMVSENLVIGKHRSRALSHYVTLNRRAIREKAADLIRRFDIRPADPDVLAGHLSGGNAQKVIVAREFDYDPILLVANQPTRGLDVSAIEYIHRCLLEARRSGKGILLVSMELDEIMSLSDRILVMYGGEIVGEFLAGEASVEEIGLSMLQGRRSRRTDEAR